MQKTEILFEGRLYLQQSLNIVNRRINMATLSNPCVYVFCGCEAIQSIYDVDEQEIGYKVYVNVFWILIVMMVGAIIGLKWFIFKDYYPLKEKSPILGIMMVMLICCSLIFYPVMYLLNYFTLFWNTPNDKKLLFRAISQGLIYSPYLIYFVRCMRISYAHDTHTSLSKTLPFKIFQKEYILALFVSAVCILQSFPIFFDRQNNFDRHFLLVVQYEVPGGKEGEDTFIIRNLVINFGWQILLIYCLWLQRKINERYSMKKELLFAISTNFLISVSNIIVFFIYRTDAFIYPSNCYTTSSIITSNSQILHIVNLLALLYISCLQPLLERRIYHRLLPTGRHYGFIKTMRDFLMEEEFLRVFTKYLQHLDGESQTDEFSSLLCFWKQLVTLKLSNEDSELEKLNEIKELVEEYEKTLFEEQQKLIVNLKDSILSLEESITNSEIIKQRYRNEINEKVDQLEKLALQKLDKVYVQNYSKTQSYFHLKAITTQNKRVNLNLIMLNLALIVDSENQFK